MNPLRIAIFGATSAIAQAVAARYAKRGASFWLVARSAERLASVASHLEALGAAKVSTVVADLDVSEAHAELATSVSNFECDIALLAHGILGDQMRAERSFDEVEKILHTNFIAPVSLLTHLANAFAARRKGVIAVVGSVAGDRGRASNYVYGASKGGLEIFLQGLRNRLHAHGVRVVTLKPGTIATPMTAHLRRGNLTSSPETAARAIERALDGGCEVSYVPWFWRWIMLMIRLIPERLFRNLKL